MTVFQDYPDHREGPADMARKVSQETHHLWPTHSYNRAFLETVGTPGLLASQGCPEKREDLARMAHQDVQVPLVSQDSQAPLGP